ncbi:MAG: ABC transporter ATP-binding protein [Antricoccus sp.]
MNANPLIDSVAASVGLTDITKRFGDTSAVTALSLQLAAGSFTALLGPSGCGKSTTLAMLAGLLSPDEGDITLDGTSMLRIAVEKRPVSLVFQKPLLFPHLDVAQNVGFGLRMRGFAARDITVKVQSMLERVQLGGLGARRVGELSGGQEQRVALARALILAPRLLLLDEPFSQLDAELRAEMRALVRTLHNETQTTTLFVTHDQIEAVEVADQIVLMLDGRLAGKGSPELFYQSPPTLQAARFFGVTNEICGSVCSGIFSTPFGFARPTAAADGDAVLVVRPEALRLSDCAAPDSLPGKIVAARFAGTYLALEMTTVAGLLVAHVAADTPAQIGGSVHVRVPVDASTVFRTDSA